MSRKQWPEDNKYASFEDISTPICDAIRFCYKLERQNEDKDCLWTGFPDPLEGLSVLTPEETLTAGNLEYSLTDQGRDALQEIVGIAIRQGMEQKRRIMWDELRSTAAMVEMFLVQAGSSFDALQEQIGKPKTK